MTRKSTNVATFRGARPVLVSEVMSRQLEAAPSGAVYARPLPFVPRAFDRRIEVFSPKLGRRLSLTSYAAWQLWLALGVNP